MKDIFDKQGITFSNRLRFYPPAIEARVRNAWRPYYCDERDFLKECLFQRPPTEDLTLRFIDDIKGYGVFATAPIERYRYIGEYCGVVKKRAWHMIANNPFCVTYPGGFSWRTYVINARKEGNITRFINHGDANVMMRSLRFDDGLLHMVFFTSRLIHEGEELLLNYGKKYWFQMLAFPR